jgi:hypothetical protein
MLMKNPTIQQVIFWRWLHQSHIACVNFANRNATKPTPTTTILTGYATSVTTSVSISVGLTLFLKRTQSLKPFVRNLLQRLLPLPAVNFF